MRSGALLLLPLLLARPAALPAQPAPPTGEESFARGVQLHQAGDILGAIEAYRDALEKEPRRVDARSNLGAAYVRLGRYEDAVREYRRALEVEPEQAAVRFNLALALYKTGLVAEAAQELEHALARDATNKAALLLLADCQLQMGNEARVIALLESREADLGQDRLYSYLMGTALLRRNELARGQVFIDRLFKDGDTAPARVLMAVAHLRRDDARSALVDLQRAAELDPKLATVHSLQGRALMEVGQRTEALEAFRREFALNPNDFNANLYLGLLLKDDGALDEAGDHLRRANRLRPDDPRVLYGLGGLHLAAGRVQEAEKALQAVVAAVPDYAKAHVLLATAYYRLKKKDLGDQEQAVVARLLQEQQGREAGASETLGPAYKGEAVRDPGPAKDGKEKKKPDSGGGPR
jgi:tetratricopeptide (TPR) repeat protein